MKNKAASLSGELIVKKGQALPTTDSTKWLEDEKKNVAQNKSGTIAVTLRLDPTRYEKLKLYGVYNRKTNQDIIVAALDAYLESFQ